MNETKYQSLLSQIKVERQRRNINQAHMARALNISQTAYGKLENGKSLISFDRLDEICKVLSLSMFDMLRLLYTDETMMKVSNISLQCWNALETDQKWFNIVKSMIYEIRGRLNNLVSAEFADHKIQQSIIEELAVKYQDLINLVEIYEFSRIHEDMKNAD